MKIETFEVSRRIKTGQRAKFDFVSNLHTLVNPTKTVVIAKPADVAIDLVTRQEGALVSLKDQRFRDQSLAINKLLKVKKRATCDEYGDVALGNIELHSAGLGQVALGMEITGFTYSLSAERDSLRREIGLVCRRTLKWGNQNKPFLRLALIEGAESDIDRIANYAGHYVPSTTSVFDASPRGRMVTIPSDLPLSDYPISLNNL